MKRAMVIINGFLHDFSTGLWAACWLAIWWLHRSSVSGPADEVIGPVMKQFFFTGVACTVVVMATGAGRTFTYIDNVYGQDSELLRRRMLIIKHVILLGVFGVGTWIQYRLAFSPGV